MPVEQIRIYSIKFYGILKAIRFDSRMSSRLANGYDTNARYTANTNDLEALRNRYQILETDSGLQISESRYAFDVMEAQNEGDSIYQIAQTFNLTPYRC